MIASSWFSIEAFKQHISNTSATHQQHTEFKINDGIIVVLDRGFHAVLYKPVAVKL